MMEETESGSGRKREGRDGPWSLLPVDGKEQGMFNVSECHRKPKHIDEQTMGWGWEVKYRSPEDKEERSVEGWDRLGEGRGCLHILKNGEGPNLRG